MLKKLCISILFLTLTLAIFAQRPGGGRPDMAGMPADGIITGKVLEYSTGKPMGYANVVLFSYQDSSIVAGAVTAMDGSFKLEKLPYGRFFVVANFIGFTKETFQDIKINPKKTALDMGVIQLHSSTETLEAVEITAQKEHIEYQIDKKVVNVSQDIMAQGGTAVTALENTPSVQVDIDGNVSLRGSTSFTVLVDGRPSVLEGTDALQQIPASNIETIEIITNPSAKYDPDGVAGIINVVLKEKVEKGFSGVVNASISNNESYSLDFLLNYRYKKFNFFGGADYRDRNHGGERNSENETYLNDTTFYRNSFGDRGRGRKGYSVRAGFDYYLSDETTIGVQAQAGYYEFNGGGTSNLHVFSAPITIDQYTSTETLMNRSGNYYSGTLNFQHKFDDFGHKIDASANYKYRSGDDSDDQKEYLTDSHWNIIEDEPFYIRTTEVDDSDELQLKLDYTKPIGEEGKVEAGMQVRVEDQTETYVFNDWDYFYDGWIEDSTYSNKSDFRRDVYAVYGIYSNSWKSFGYQVGLRGEYTYREIKNQKSNDASLIDRWDYFPTIHLSQSFANKDQMLASYTKRIQRPRSWYLDPFVNFMDQYNYRQGNPNLEPEYTDSYELGYQKRIWESMISLEGYYRETHNKITRIRSLQDNGTFLHTFENLDSDYALGGELMVRTDPAKWLNLTVSGNVYHYRLDGSVNEESVDTESLNWNGRVNMVFKLPLDFRLQLNGMYNGSTVTAQGEMGSFFMTNAAVKKDFLQKQLTATISARDIFNTGKYEFTSRGEGFYTHDYFNRDAPIVSLSLSWKINNYKKQVNGNGDEGGGMEGEMDF